MNNKTDFDPKMNTIVDYFNIEYYKYVGQMIFSEKEYLNYNEWMKQLPEFIIKDAEEYERYSVDTMNNGSIPLTIEEWNKLKYHL